MRDPWLDLGQKNKAAIQDAADHWDSWRNVNVDCRLDNINVGFPNSYHPTVVMEENKCPKVSGGKSVRIMSSTYFQMFGKKDAFVYFVYIEMYQN